MMDKGTIVDDIATILGQWIDGSRGDFEDCGKALYAAGYRKLPMVECLCAKQPWDEPPCQACSDHESHGPWCICHGSGKLPERPKVLSEEELVEADKKLFDNKVFIEETSESARWFIDRRNIAQAQLDSAWEEIKRHYEGKDG